MTQPSPVLVTGFSPFGGDDVNPSQLIAQALDGQTVQRRRIIGAVLPVTFAAAVAALDELIDAHRPVLVVALGQAGGRSELSFERVAINLVDARIADNAGDQPIDQPVIAGAPAAYFSTLPVKAMQADLQAIGIPSALSTSAGTFVCNQVFFALAHAIATRLPTARGGFIHVPWLPEQATRNPGQPSMALATMIAGVHKAIDCALTTGRDAVRVGGSTH